MNIRGKLLQHVDVEIDPHRVVEQVIETIMRNNGFPPDSYINSKGEIETWDAGRGGSGYYEQHGKATDQQAVVLKTCKDFQRLLRSALSPS